MENGLFSRRIKGVVLALFMLVAAGVEVYGQKAMVEVRIVYDYGELTMPIKSSVSVICDGLDSVLWVEPDSTGRISMEVPVGVCWLYGFRGIDDPWALGEHGGYRIDVAGDTTMELTIREGADSRFRYFERYNSRREKDSVLYAEEAKLKSSLNSFDTDYYEKRRNYEVLSDLYAKDLYYPLPQWRTFSNDTILKYLKYSYRKEKRRCGGYYYAIRQLERKLRLEHDRRVKEPQADESWYVPMPELKEEWLTDTVERYDGYYGSAHLNSWWMSEFLKPMGEKSLAYPVPKERVVRLWVAGGLSIPVSYRVERGQVYYAESEHWCGKSSKRFSAALTDAELSTLNRMVDILDTVTDEFRDNLVIDAPTITIEWSGPEMYHNVEVNNTKVFPCLESIIEYLKRIEKRYMKKVSFMVVDDSTGEMLSERKLMIDGHKWHEESYSLSKYSGQDSTYRYMPKGRYRLRIGSGMGYEGFEVRFRVKDDMSLGTIRLKRKKNR